jgi:hypothetical protein
MAFLAGAVPSRAAGDAFPARLGNSVVVLTGPWKFHPGDDPGWARPEFDDSGWGTLDLTPPENSYDPVTGASGYTPGWTANGYPHLTGYAWYRLRLDVENEAATSDAGSLALTMPINFDDAYQVFVNGQKVGDFGRFGGSQVTYYNAQPRSFPLPAGIRGGPITIAIRVWMDYGTGLLSSDAGGLHGPPMLGQANTIEAMLRLEWDAVNRTELGNLASASFSVLVALLGFVLFALDRREPVYLWLGLACASAGLARILVLLGYYTLVLPMVPETCLQDVLLSPLTLGFWTMFWAYWFRLVEVERVARVTLGLVCAGAISIAVLRPPLYGAVIPAGVSTWMVPVSVMLKLALGAVLVWVTIKGIRARASGAWLAVVPVLLTVEWQYNEELSVVHFPQVIRLGGLAISTGQITNVAMLAIVSVLLIKRFIGAQRGQELLRVEIEQARQVQQVIIPEAIPTVPGFKLASDYRPAQQVGGDFFQILATEGGGVLAVIGDVSGKGMPAAMTVSLLVGTVRTLAHFTRSPGEILRAMNVRMLGRMQGGFTTCLVLRVDADGTVTAANAGHLNPYCDGSELGVEAGLPLGLSTEDWYPEAQFRLELGKQLTLLTDGVVEARARSGELLGFERTAAMATQPAASIAQAAQEFGQNDDITVLTFARVSVGEEHAAVVGGSILSPAEA